MLVANNAELGIQLIREKRPDLVLMDIQLPGMDGLSATKVIKYEGSDSCNPSPGLAGLSIYFV
jgi:YesN/AraC family two-component response regulator